MSLATELTTSLGRSISNTLKGSAGNLVEWYDVYVYSTFAMYFEAQFFDPNDKNSTIYVWATFAVTFLMRPVGSWFFGRYADRYGRRASLTLSVTIMAICSIAVAVMPTRSVLGVGAAVLLILARLVQGFATGGEYGTSATYMSEAAWARRRGFLSSFQYVTLVGGQVLAQLVLLIMLLTIGHDAIAEWGWRVAFGIGGVAAVVVFWIRRTMDESLKSEDIVAAKTGAISVKSHGSIVELFGGYWREVLLVVFITMGGTLTFYVYTVVGPTVVEGTVGATSPVLASTVSLIALTIYMLLQPLGGWIADIVGYRSQLVFYGIGALVFTWVFVLVLPNTNSGFAAFGILIVAFIIETAYTSISAIVKAQVFPAYVRAIGVGIAYAIANSMFGGSAPLIFAAFTGADNTNGFVVYASIVIAASLVTYLFFLKNKGPNWLDDPELMQRRRLERKATVS